LTVKNGSAYQHQILPSGWKLERAEIETAIAKKVAGKHLSW